jgi:hypothetical protein
MKKSKPLVMVTWRDAHSAMSYRPEGDYPMYTVGWLLKRGRRWTTLADETSKKGSKWRGYTRIPTPNVLAVRTLRFVNETEKERASREPEPEKGAS